MFSSKKLCSWNKHKIPSNLILPISRLKIGSILKCSVLSHNYRHKDAGNIFLIWLWSIQTKMNSKHRSSEFLLLLLCLALSSDPPTNMLQVFWSMQSLSLLMYFGPESCLMQHEWKMSHDDAGGSECLPKVVQMKLRTRPARATFLKVDIVDEVIQESKEDAGQSSPSQRFSSLYSLFVGKWRSWTEHSHEHTLVAPQRSMQTVTVEVTITETCTYLWWSHGWLTDSTVERLIPPKLTLSTSGKYCCYPPSSLFNNQWPFQ